MNNIIKKRMNQANVVYGILCITYLICVINNPTIKLSLIDLGIVVLYLLVANMFWYVFVNMHNAPKEKLCRKQPLTYDPKQSLLKSSGIETVVKICIAALVLIGILIVWYLEDTDSFWTEFCNEAIRKTEEQGAIKLLDFIMILLALIPCISGFYEGIRTKTTEKYMFFEFSQLPEIRRGNVCVLIEFSVILVWKVLRTGGFSPGNQISVAFAVVCVGGVLYIVYCYIKRLLPWANKEKELIKEIDKYYWYKDIHVLPRQPWTKSRMLPLFAKQYNTYLKNIKKIKIESLKGIEFGNIYENNGKNIALSRKRWKGSVVVVTILALEFGISIMQTTGKGIGGGIMCIMLICTMPLICPAIEKGKMDFMYTYFSRFYISEWGYYITAERKVKYISSYDKRKTKYGKVICGLKVMLCFYNLANGMRHEDVENENIGKEYLNAICDKMLNQQEVNGLAILPILLCYCIKPIDNVEKIRRLVKRAKVSWKEMEIIKEVSLLILRDWVGDDEEYRRDYFKKRLKTVLY